MVIPILAQVEGIPPAHQDIMARHVLAKANVSVEQYHRMSDREVAALISNYKLVGQPVQVGDTERQVFHVVTHAEFKWLTEHAFAMVRA